MHGTAHDEPVRGSLARRRHLYIYIGFGFVPDGFSLRLGTGGCTDSQAICGGIGNGPMGPYKITSNFLEAAGSDTLAEPLRSSRNSGRFVRRHARTNALITRPQYMPKSGCLEQNSAGRIEVHRAKQLGRH
jgi:hypothetical protein